MCGLGNVAVYVCVRTRELLERLLRYVRSSTINGTRLTFTVTIDRDSNALSSIIAITYNSNRLTINGLGRRVIGSEREVLTTGRLDGRVRLTIRY